MAETPFEKITKALADDTPSEMPADIQEVYVALSMYACPWYQGYGICESGCSSEPQCQTCEPEGGWLAELRQAVAAL